MKKLTKEQQKAVYDFIQYSYHLFDKLDEIIDEYFIFCNFKIEEYQDNFLNLLLNAEERQDYIDTILNRNEYLDFDEESKFYRYSDEKDYNRFSDIEWSWDVDCNIQNIWKVFNFCIDENHILKEEAIEDFYEKSYETFKIVFGEDIMEILVETEGEII